MKKMHIWKVASMLIVTLMGLAMAMSCSKDDDGEGGSKLKRVSKKDIVGMWRTSETNNNVLWVFESNGNGELYEHYDNEETGADKSTFTYSFNEELQTINIVPVETESGLKEQTIKVASQDGDNLALSFQDNSSLSLKYITTMPVICDKPDPRTFELHDDQEEHFYAKKCYISVYNYDEDNKFTISTDASWLKHSETRVGNQYENAKKRKYTSITLDFDMEYNLERTERCAVVTVTKTKTGETYSMTVTQRPYVSIDGSNFKVTYMGSEYEGTTLNSGGSDGKEAFYVTIRTYDDISPSISLSSSWVKLVSKRELEGEGYGCKHRYSYGFSCTENPTYDRMMNILFYNSSDSYVFTVIQKGLYGPQGGYSGDGDCTHCKGSGVCSYCNGVGRLWGYGYNGKLCPRCNGSKECKYCNGTGWAPETEHSSSGGSSSGSGSSGGKIDYDQLYDFTSTSVGVGLDSNDSYSKSTPTMKKGVEKGGSRVCLFSLSKSTNYGTASHNSDRTCGTFSVSSYSYVVKEYPNLSQTVYYYFN